MLNEKGMDTKINSEDLAGKPTTCPVCGNVGQAVEGYTVEHLVTAAQRMQVEADQYRICLDEDCPVVYYSLAKGIKFMKDQVTVPIWFKTDAHPKYACYCSQVTEEEVSAAVLHQGARTVRDVIRLTGAMKDSSCKEKNPLGVCCHGIIQTGIDKALKDK